MRRALENSLRKLTQMVQGRPATVGQASEVVAISEEEGEEASMQVSLLDLLLVWEPLLLENKMSMEITCIHRTIISTPSNLALVGHFYHSRWAHQWEWPR